MSLSNAPIQDQMVTRDGLPTNVWSKFFVNVSALLGNSPLPLLSVTVAGLAIYPAAKNTGCLVFVSNESGGATVAFSDSVNWRRCQDRAIVS